MKKTIGILAVLLAAQVGLAVALNVNSGRLSEGPAQVALFDTTPKAIDRIVIEGPDGDKTAKTVLARAGDGWQLPEADNFPADGKKVDTMLEKLVKLKEGLPVATSDDAVKRFKLADDGFERRITLAKGDKTLGTLYLGTSQGTRAVHARRGDQDAVYEVGFAVYDAPATRDDWLDKTVLYIPKEEIAAIDVDGLHLVATIPEPAKTDDADKKDAAAADPVWALLDAGDNKLAPKAADALSEKLADLRITSVLGSDAKPDYGLDTPVLSLSLTRTNGDKVDYALGKAGDKDDYTLKTSLRPEYFKLTSYAAQQLVKAAGRDALLEKPAEANHAAAAEVSTDTAPATASN